MSPDLSCVCFSIVTLKMLYKVKTCKVFEKPKAAEGRGSEVMEEDPYVVQSVIWCPHSQLLCVVGFSAYAILYRFNKHDATTEIVVSKLLPPPTGPPSQPPWGTIP